jgi:hypothetical protein
VANDQEITIKISAKNLTSDAFAQARKEVAGLSDTAAKGAKESESAWSSFGTSFKSVGGMAVAAAAAIGAAITGLVAGVVALGAHGADVADVREQFNTLNTAIGNDSTAAITALDDAMGGTVPTFELMKTVNAGLSQGLKASVGDLQLMGDVSRVLADRIGGDAATAFTTLTDAMASGKDMQLKTIGLNIDAKAVTEAYAKSVGLAAADLDEFQIKEAKRVAILQEAKRVLQESGKAQNDFGDAVAMARTKLTNFMDDIAVGIAQSPVLGAAIDGIRESLGAAFGGSTQGLVKTIIDLIERGSIQLMEFARTGITVGSVMARVFGGTLTILGSVGTALSGIFTGIAIGVEKMLELGSKIPGIGDALKGPAEQARVVAEGFKLLTTDLAAGTAAGFEMAKGNGQLFDTLKSLDAGLATTRDRMVNALAATNAHTEATKGNTVAARADTDAQSIRAKQYEHLQEVLKKFPSLAATMAAEWDRIMAAAEEKATRSQDARNKGLLTNLSAIVAAERSASDIRNKRSMTDLEFQQTIIKREAQDKKDALDQNGAQYAEAMEAIDQETDQKMHQAAVDYMDALDAMKDHTKDWSVMVNKWIGSVPELIKSAFTGGGGLGGAAKALFSGIGGDSLGKLFGGGEDGKFFGISLGSVTNKLGSMFGKTIGGALGVALPGIGSALGAFAGPLIGTIGGFFKRIFSTAGRDAVRDFASGLGGFDALHQQLGALGAEGEQLWIKLTQGVGRGNAQQAKEAIDAVTKALGEYQQQLDSAKTAEEGVADRMSHLTEITPDLQAALDKAYDAKNPEDYTAALKGVGDVMDAQDAKQKQLDATLQKYGLSWTDLGASARAAKLGDIAGGLITDFMTLKDAGVDINHVMEKMKPTLQDFVNQAKKTGTEVPESMKPVLQSAIDAGVLFDENGKKITDMTGTGLTFGQTMTQNFKDVSSAIEHLAQVLEGQIVGGFQSAADRAKGAINSIPTSRDFSVNGVYNAPDVPSDDGSDLPGHAAGGLFNTPHIARIAEAGQPEIVGSQEFMAKALAGAIQMVPGGAPGGAAVSPITLVVNTPIGLSDTIRQVTFEEIWPNLKRLLEGNHGGSRTQLQQILAMGNA